MNGVAIEGDPTIRHCCDIRPLSTMCRARPEPHDPLKRENGFVTAGVFMPNATVTGSLRSDATIPELIGAVDRALAG